MNRCINILLQSLVCALLIFCVACDDKDSGEGKKDNGGGESGIVYSPSSPVCGEVVTFSLSNVPDGSASVSWNFGDGNFASATAGESVTNIFVDAGSYTVRAYLTISGSLTELSETVSIANSNAAIQVSNVWPARMEKVTLSLNDVLNVSSVSWDFGDGSDTQTVTSPTERLTHQYEKEGEYTVGATVSYTNTGETSLLTQDLTVAGESLSYTCLNFDKSKMWIMAHRGNSDAGYTLPPNSLAGFRKTVEDGYADFIELDVQLTKDNVVVLMHDNHLRNFTNFSQVSSGDGLIADYTYEQIKQYRLVTTDGKVTDEIVPTLEDALTEFADKIFFSIDKVDDATITTTTLEKVYEVVKRCGCLDRAHFQVGNSGNTNAKWLSEQDPTPILMPHANSNNQLSTMLMYQPYYVIATSTATIVSDISWLATINANGISLANLLDSYQDNFINGNTATMDSFVSAGLNMVQTDYPENMHNYLQQKGKR